MRTLTLLITFGFILACSDKRNKDAAIFFYTVGSTGKITKDTTQSIQIHKLDSADELLSQYTFKYHKINHVIKVYTSDNHAPVDGGDLYYTLDSIGIIYIRSTTWRGFSRLKSNNDSINDLIDQTFAHIIEIPELHCYQCRLIDTTTMTFIPPVIKDE